MRSYHWGLIAIVFIAAIVFDRFFPALGNLVPLLPKS